VLASCRGKEWPEIGFPGDYWLPPPLFLWGMTTAQQIVRTLGAAVLLWTALIYRSQTIHRTFDVPVTFNLLPTPLTVTPCDPPAVLVTLAGQRKDFAFLKASDVNLAYGLLDATPGRRTLPVTVRDLSFPETGIGRYRTPTGAHTSPREAGDERRRL
jgi:hypothetical protein